MSIWNQDVFFKSDWAEKAIFKAGPESQEQEITVIVNREEPRQTNFKGSNIPSVSYPLTVDIQKCEVAAIEMMVSTIKVKNIEYVEKTLPLQKVVYADEYIWRVAL
jgi:molybdate-binding protein